jgi:AbiV family abortive infection protein
MPEERLRCAFVLALLALEETGKLFKVWQAGAHAEEASKERIEVQDLFADHEAKGAVAGDLCCQMLDFVWKVGGSVAPEDKWATDAHTHLMEVYRDFESVREIAMYTADDDGEGWAKTADRVRSNIDAEISLLWLVSSGALAYLETRGHFSTATKALVDIRAGVKSGESYEFYGRMMEGMLKIAEKWKVPAGP